MELVGVFLRCVLGVPSPCGVEVIGDTIKTILEQQTRCHPAAITMINEQPNVQFEEGLKTERSFGESALLARWVMRYSGGFIKDEKQANSVLIGFAVVALAAAAFLFFNGGGNEVSSPSADLINTPQPREGAIPR